MDRQYSRRHVVYMISGGMLMSVVTGCAPVIVTQPGTFGTAANDNFKRIAANDNVPPPPPAKSAALEPPVLKKATVVPPAHIAPPTKPALGKTIPKESSSKVGTLTSDLAKGKGRTLVTVTTGSLTPTQSLLNAIAQAEGTAGRGDYEAVLGYGRYGTPPKPITSMTLAEAFAFGRQIKARHGSSSALGIGQIVGNTMKDAAQALGMEWDTTKFDAPTQDRMILWIARNQGLGAWEGFKMPRGQKALAQAQAALAAGALAPESGMELVENAKRISSTFGMRHHPLSGEYKMHWGLDIAGPAGATAKAAKAGIVESINDYGDVTVLHGDGSRAVYRHIHAAIVKGQEIAAGQIVGRLRAFDPRSTGPHLHLEELDSTGRKIDPRSSLLQPATRR